MLPRKKPEPLDAEAHPEPQLPYTPSREELLEEYSRAIEALNRLDDREYRDTAVAARKHSC